jgi:hypothetical protein
MRVGVAIQTPDPSFPDTAARLEAAGVDSLWFGLVGSADPIVMAAAAATVTTRVNLFVVLHAPTPVTAKSIASLDALSRGRVRVVVETREEVALLRRLLDDREIPMLPPPFQDHVPVWSRSIELTDEVDGIVIDGAGDVPERHTAVVVDWEGDVSLTRVDAARRAGADELVLRTVQRLWETVGKVLARIQNRKV